MLPIHLAAKDGNDVQLAMLITSGTEVDAPDNKQGKTPLMYAVKKNIVNQLVNSRANVNATSQTGQTALTIVASSASCRLGTENGLVEALLLHRADVNHTADSGLSPLMGAVGKHDESAVKLLLAAGADTSLALHESGETPLILASRRGYLAMVKLLIDARASLDAVDEEGVTALIAATEGNHGNVVSVLVEAGADVEARDIDGEAAFDIASYRNCSAIAAKLEDSIDRIAVMIQLGDVTEDGAILVSCMSLLTGDEFTSIPVLDNCTVGHLRDKLGEQLEVHAKRVNILASFGAVLVDDEASLVEVCSE